jgi:uncharacterized membrane protein YqhA
LDDLKGRLAKVILMILIVTLFEEALNLKIENPLDLLYLGASIALVAAALYLSHAAEAVGHGSGDSHAEEHEEDDHAEEGKKEKAHH